jgi:hypothetical protein
MTANSDRPDDTIVVVPGEVIPPDESEDSTDPGRLDQRPDEDEQLPSEPAAEPMAHRAWGGAVPSQRQPEDEPAATTSDRDVAAAPPPGTPTGGLDAADTDPDITGTQAAVPDEGDEDLDGTDLDGTDLDGTGLDGTGLLDDSEIDDRQASDTVMADTEGVPAADVPDPASTQGPDLGATGRTGRHAGPEPGLTAPSTTATGTTDVSQAVTDSQWSAIQAAFVDDPRQAVEQAAQVASTALQELMSAARSREQAISDGWQNQGTGTEDLRMALRGYRDLAGRVASLAREF